MQQLKLIMVILGLLAVSVNITRGQAGQSLAQVPLALGINPNAVSINNILLRVAAQNLFKALHVQDKVVSKEVSNSEKNGEEKIETAREFCRKCPFRYRDGVITCKALCSKYGFAIDVQGYDGNLELASGLGLT